MRIWGEWFECSTASRKAQEVVQNLAGRWCIHCTTLYAMPTLHKFPDCRVLVYFGDHPPPHVHVVKGDGRDCIVEIETLRIVGKLAAREIRSALDWIAKQKPFLLAEWQRCNP